MSDQKFCCDEFDELVTAAQFKRLDDGTWVVNGCCGGGCYVITDMRFCPFCGSALTSEPV